jgi:predicted Zn-dependent protease with MMP-like domain
MTVHDGMAPSLDEFDALACAAFAGLPAVFRQRCDGLVIVVQDWPDEAMLDDLAIDDPYELTGLYEGVDIGAKSVEDSGALPDRVFLFRRPILDEWADRGNVTLGELVTHILVHEIGHHMGLDDAAIAEIDDWTA